jgi:hypothetical protein
MRPHDFILPFNLAAVISAFLQRGGNGYPATRLPATLQKGFTVSLFHA